MAPTEEERFEEYERNENPDGLELLRAVEEDRPNREVAKIGAKIDRAENERRVEETGVC